MNYIIVEFEDLTHSLSNPRAENNFPEDVIHLLPKPTLYMILPKI
jgi:hypothetical protein